jgi:hypothetical protein
LTDTSSNEDSVSTVRVLKPDDRDTVSVYIRNGDNWDAVSSTEIGSYIEFDITGTDAIIRIHGEDKPDYRILMAAGGIVIVLVAAKIAVKKKKQRKEAYERTNHDQGSDI